MRKGGGREGAVPAVWSWGPNAHTRRHWNSQKEIRVCTSQTIAARQPWQISQSVALRTDAKAVDV